MSAKVVRLQDFGKELEAESDRQIEALRIATLKGVVEAIPYLVAQSPVDTGLYAQSWNFSEEEGKVILGNYAPHAAVIEYGARPFTPPLDPLLAWAKRVLNDGSQPPDYSPQVQSLARAVQWKIKHYGMKPKNIMTNAIPEIIEDIKRHYEKELKRGPVSGKVLRKAGKIALKGGGE